MEDINKRKVIISPSIASANQLLLREEVKKVEDFGCADIQIDIEDGNFIPNITFGMKTIRALRSVTMLPFSFHLMTVRQLDLLREVSKFQPSIVFGHYEAISYPREFIGLANELKVRCGMAFNPKTPVDSVRYVVNNLSGILLLTCEPDYQGEMFLPQVLEKVKQVRSMSEKVEIWLDGNIRLSQLDDLQSYGVTHAVVGRDFFGNIADFKNEKYRENRADSL
jgi:ribulose-phosphate 3-epimerase